MLRRLRVAMPVLLAYGLVVAVCVMVTHGYTLVSVAGGSMVPALTPGDVVVVAKKAPVRPGDIALMQPAATLVLHRVTRIGADGLVWTRGDANPVADLNGVPIEAIRGRVVRVAPLGLLIRHWRGSRRCDTLSAQSDSTKR